MALALGLSACNSQLKLHSQTEGDSSIASEFDIDSYPTQSSTAPIVTWKNSGAFKKVQIRISTDQECKQVVKSVTVDGTQESATLGVYEDGHYYVCLYGENAEGKLFPAANNGIMLTFDKTPPIIAPISTVLYRRE